MNKDLRREVYNKYNGRCAYCGKDLQNKMQVDHIYPVNRGLLGSRERMKNAESIEMLNPSCGRCNRYKSTMSIETFRRQISEHVKRARNKSWNFRIAEDFGLIKETGAEVVFYYEKSL